MSDQADRPIGPIVLTEAAMTSTNPLSVAVRTLIQAGHEVELVDSPVPGIFRVDGGPELTVGQIKFMARTIDQPLGVLTPSRT